MIQWCIVWKKHGVLHSVRGPYETEPAARVAAQQTNVGPAYTWEVVRMAAPD
jgi:hypothetical protein